jgi:ABC-type multidrug transport system permease subunit
MTKKLTESPSEIYDPFTYIFYLGLSFSAIMLHSSTASIIGYGIANSKRKWAITFSLIIQAIFNMVLLLILYAPDFKAIAVIVTVIYSFLILYHIVYNDLLINTLPHNLRKKLIRKEVNNE